MELPATYVEGFHNQNSVRHMEYRELGKTGLKVSKISLGGGTLSSLYGDVSLENAVRTIREAIRSGINYIDTAPFYGQGKSEEILGIALKEIPRKAYYIATKIGRYEINPPNQFNFTAKETIDSVNKSLSLLRLDYVDIIQIHDIEFGESVKEVLNEALPALEQVVKDGKAKFIGVTGYPLSVLKDAILQAPNRFDTVLSYSRYTLIDDTLLEYLPFFKEQNLGVICAAGHAMGLLTNAGSQPWHPAPQELKDLCKEAADFCRTHKVELGKLAMYHFMQLKEPATFLVGMQTYELLSINLDAYFNGLTIHEENILGILKKKYFSSKYNWEGLELERYWAAQKK